MKPVSQSSHMLLNKYLLYMWAARELLLCCSLWAESFKAAWLLTGVSHQLVPPTWRHILGCGLECIMADSPKRAAPSTIIRSLLYWTPRFNGVILHYWKEAVRLITNEIKYNTLLSLLTSKLPLHTLIVNQSQIWKYEIKIKLESSVITLTFITHSLQFR